MEEKKTNELPDEALDAVAGGATCKYDPVTKRWLVYRQDGSFYAEYIDGNVAKSAAWNLSVKEKEESFKSRSPQPFNPPPAR